MDDSEGSARSVAARIRRRLGRLTPTERRPALALLANYPVTGLETVAQFAARANVSGPTILRLDRQARIRQLPRFPAGAARRAGVAPADPARESSAGSGRPPRAISSPPIRAPSSTISKHQSPICRARNSRQRSLCLPIPAGASCSWAAALRPASRSISICICANSGHASNWSRARPPHGPSTCSTSAATMCLSSSTSAASRTMWFASRAKRQRAGSCPALHRYLGLAGRGGGRSRFLGAHCHAVELGELRRPVRLVGGAHRAPACATLEGQQAAHGEA